MRKYKKAGKRILGLLLTVCLVLGLMPEMPAVYAASNDISGAEVTLYKDAAHTIQVKASTYTYTGSQIKPYVEVKYNGVTLQQGTDYGVSYGANVNVSDDNYVEVIGQGAYANSIKQSISINKKMLDNITITCKLKDDDNVPYCFYTGPNSVPEIESIAGRDADDSRCTMVLNSDYEISYAYNNAVCTDISSGDSRPYILVKLLDTGNFSYSDTNQKKQYFRIYYDMNRVEIIGNKTLTYTGYAQTPNFTVKNTLLNTETNMFRAKWDKNTEVGSPVLTLTGIGDYYGTKVIDKEYTIVPANIKDVTVAFDAEYYEYTGDRLDMSSHITVKLGDYVIPNTNYTVSYLDGYKGNVGNNSVIITCDKNFANASNRFDFKIYSTIVSCNVNKPEIAYTGNTLKPDLTVKDKLGNEVPKTAYRLSYYTSKNYDSDSKITDPKAVGTYYVQIEGMEDNYYKGMLGNADSPISFQIVPKSMDTLRFSMNSVIVTYDLYSSDIFNNKTYYNTISKIEITDDTTKLVKDIDYTVNFYSDFDCTNELTEPSKFINAGMYYVKITGMGAYDKSVHKLRYEIKPLTLAAANVKIEVAKQTYTGNPIVPDPKDITVTATINNNTVTIDSSSYRILPCSNNLSIGTATINIQLFGNYKTNTTKTIDTVTYTDVATGTFSIIPKKLRDCEMTQSTKETVYNGQLQKPTVTINDGSKTLGNDDYSISYYTDERCSAAQKVDGFTNVGKYWIKITGKGIYAPTEPDDDIVIGYTINAKSFTSNEITVTASNCDYTGIEVTPGLTVKDGETLLNLNDYTIDGYFEDLACLTSKTPISGQCYVRVTGKGNYIGSKPAVFYIGKDFKGLGPTLELSGKALVYNTKSHYDELNSQIVIRDSAGEIISQSYYDIHYYSDTAHATEITEKNHNLFKNAGTIYIGISGKNGYYGTVYDKITIAARDISTMDATVLGTYVYTGSAIALTKYDGTDLTKTDGVLLRYPATEGIDYILAKDDYDISGYFNNVNAGSGEAGARVTLTGKGNYTGYRTVYFAINQKSLNDLANLVVTIPSATFTSRKQKPMVTVTYANGNQTVALDSTTEYSIACYKDQSYSIEASDADLTNAGSVYVKITGKGNYKDTITNNILGASNIYTINPRDINEATVSLTNKDGSLSQYVYSKILTESKIPEFTVKYEYVTGSFYTLSGTSEYSYTPTEVGYHIGEQDIDIKAAPNSNFMGIKTVKYCYLGDMSNAADEIDVSGIEESYAYKADTATNGVTCSNIVVYAKKNNGEVIGKSCYDVSYKNNKAAGLATVEIKGKSEKYWTGTYTKTFKITGSIADAEITIPTQAYTGTAYTGDTLKDIQVTCDGYNLQYGVDYEIISVVNGTNASLSTVANPPTITIKGKGDYFSGTATKTAAFAIKYDINSPSLQVKEIPDQIYTGSAVEPLITVTYLKPDGTYASLAKDQDYKIQYFNNTAVGAANGITGPYVVITSTGTGLLKDGSLTVPFSIGQVNIADETLGYHFEGILDEYLYTGEVIRPTVVIKDKNDKVLADTNYKVEYSPANLVQADPDANVTIKVTGKGNYYGTISTSFKIVKRSLDSSKAQVTVTIPDQTYTAKKIEPTFKVEFTDYAGNPKSFELNKDYYIVGYFNNIDAMEAGLEAYDYIDGPYVQIKAIDGKSLTGIRNIPFNILPKSMENLVYSNVPDMTYEPGRTEYKPEVTVKLAKDSATYLENLKDYRLIYHNYTKVADANGQIGPYIEVIPYDYNQNLTGTKIIPYTIKKKSLKSEDITIVLSDADETNKFDPVRRNYPNVGIYYPTIRIFDYADPENPVELKSGTDFGVGTFTGNGATGTVTVPIEGKTNYMDSIQATFTIGTLFDTEHINITQNNSPLQDGKLTSNTYNGKKQLPENISVKVISTAKELAAGTDYVIEIYLDAACTKAAVEDNVCNAGTYYFSIKGLTSAGFIGNIVIPYTIKQKSVNAETVKVAAIPKQSYGSGIVKPPVNITDEETGETIPTSQYDVVYKYEGRAETGEAYATVIANENGNYTGSRTVYFYIDGQDIAKATVYEVADQDYTGSEIRPDPQVYFDGIQLINGVDYVATYGNNISAGEAWTIIQGIGNYTGYTKEICFNIKANLETAIVSAVGNQIYTGKQVMPKVASVICGGNKLVEGVDYILDYEPNIIIGEGAVIILPKSEAYTGSKVIKFLICNTIESATVTNVPTSQTYTAAAITPEPIVKVGNTILKRDVHYTVKWSNDINVGTASLTVTGIGAYSGNKVVNYNIIAKSIARCSISSVSDKNYNGKTQSPAITVKDGKKVLANGVDYTVSYVNNKSIGTATINVVGKGNYSGSANVKFDIVSAPITGLKASAQTKTAAKLSWSKQKNITGYQVYTNNSKTRVAQTKNLKVTIKKLKAGTTYTYKVRTYTKIGNKTYYGDFKTITFATKPEKPKAAVSSKKTKTATISWKKVSGSNGYEVYVSNTKKGKYEPLALILKNNVLSYTNTELTKGKTYYYKVRAYRTIDGKKIYSDYSDVVSVKVK